jgi:hypothetical protein
MMILRLASYLLFLFLVCEGIALTAVGWSFLSSVQSSLSLLKYTTDNKARDLLSAMARVAETKMYVEGFDEMNSLFAKQIKQLERDQDKFRIKEIALLSNDGIVLSHSDPEEVKLDIFKRQPSAKYNKSYYMRALRMRKGQLPTPQVFGEEYKFESNFVNDLLFRFLSIDITTDLKHQNILLSAPIYHTEKLETLGTIHMVYSRGNVLFFLDSQKELFLWMVGNYTAIGFIATVILWGIFVLYSFANYRQGARVSANIPEPEPVNNTLRKLQAIVGSKEDSLKKYLTPEPLQLNTDDMAKLEINHPDSVGQTLDSNPSPIEVSNLATLKSPLNGVSVGKGKTEQKNTEAIDAIYLD